MTIDHPESEEEANSPPWGWGKRKVCVFARERKETGSLENAVEAGRQEPEKGPSAQPESEVQPATLLG